MSNKIDWEEVGNKMAKLMLVITALRAHLMCIYFFSFL